MREAFFASRGRFGGIVETDKPSTPKLLEKDPPPKRGQRKRKRRQ
jgi:hypothetical protein